MDKRWDQLADLLVSHSMAIKPTEKVMIAYGEKETYPLVYSLYRACIQAGAFVQVQFLSEELNRHLLRYGNDTQIDWLPEIEAYGMEWADVYFGLRGAYNLDMFWDIPAERMARWRRTLGKISTLRWQKTRWCLLRVPNAALAQQAGVDEETLTDMFFNACLLDWERESREWKRWAEILNRGSHLRVVGKGTDLEFSLEGRSWEVADGHMNMPDGEIATSPVESTVHGTITFDFYPFSNFCQIIKKTNTPTCQKSISIACSNLLCWDLQRDSTDICHNLQPNRILCSSAYSDNSLRNDILFAHCFQIMSNAVGNPFQNGSIDIRPGML